MIKNYSVRTDLALEEKERFESDHVEISGVVLEEDYDEASELRVTRVEIKGNGKTCRNLFDDRNS